jgi:integrase
MLWPGVPAEEAPWHELDAAMLLQLRARLMERYRFDAAGNYLSTAKAVLKAAWLLGLATSDQWSRAQEVKPPKGVALPAGSFVSDEEWRQLFAHVAADTSPRGVRDLAILTLLRGSGCRRAELVSLDLEDWQHNQAVVRFRTAKGSRQRESACPSWVQPPMAAYLRLRGPMPGPMFIRMRGGALSHGERLSCEGLHDAFKNRCRAAGLGHITLHDTRRGYISSALENGVDVVAIARNVGHQQTSTTLRYDRRPLSQLQDLAQRMPDPFST